jgi:hypothetical protein
MMSRKVSCMNNARMGDGTSFFKISKRILDRQIHAGFQNVNGSGCLFRYSARP